MTPELIQLFSNAGIAGLLAAVVIFFWRADHKDRLADEKDRTEKETKRAERERDDKMQILQTQRDLTQALTALTEVVRRIDGRNPDERP